MNIETRLIVDGEIFSKQYKNPFVSVPNAGDEILYKTFRLNPNMKSEPKDILLRVDKVSYVIEEIWNGAFMRMANIHATVISVTQRHSQTDENHSITEEHKNIQP